MTRMIEKRHGRLRVGMAFTALAMLGGCSDVPDYLNPVEWYNSTVDYVSGSDKTEAAEARDRAAAEAKTGAEKPMPSLGTVPERPNVSAEKTAREVRQGLVADTAGRKYAPAVQRQGEAQSVLGTEAPRPVAVAAPKAAQPVAPTRAAPSMPAPAPSMTAAAPPPPALAKIPPAPQTAAATPPQMPAFAAPAPPANAMMGGADEFETVVISGEGVERTSNWGRGAGLSPATVAIAPMASTAMAAPAASMPGSGQALKVATIQYRHGSAGLDDRDATILRQVLDLRKERGGRIRIVGHASSRTGDMDPVRHKMVNYQVSVDRAQAVAQQLIEMGVPGQDLVVVAKADTEPLYYEIMPSGEAGNRRTEIYLDF